MTRKFIREEWDDEPIGFERNKNKSGFEASSLVLDLFQSFEDRIERLSLLYDGICENAAKNFTKYTTIERDMARHFVAIKETFTELQQENKSLRDDVNFLALSTTEVRINELQQENKSLRDDVNYLREKVLEKNEETFKERFTLKQKMHICQMIEEWDEESRKDNWKNSLENLKCMICDTSIGETQ